MNNSYTIEQVIPHKSPMILLDKLLSYTTSSASCEVTITPNSTFFCEQINGVASYIGTEYMAQTIAAYAGANALDNNKSVQIGFLIGTRKYKTQQSIFACGDVLKIAVVQLYQEESGLSVFDCSIKHEENLLCEAKINVFQPPNPVQFIREKQ